MSRPKGPVSGSGLLKGVDDDEKSHRIIEKILIWYNLQKQMLAFVADDKRSPTRESFAFCPLITLV